MPSPRYAERANGASTTTVSVSGLSDPPPPPQPAARLASAATTTKPARGRRTRSSLARRRDLLRRSDRHRPPLGHDHDPVGDRGHEPQVVLDDDERDTELLDPRYHGCEPGRLGGGRTGRGLVEQQD